VGTSLEKRNPVTLYNSNSLFHRPRRTSRQTEHNKPMVVDADLMTLLAIREQEMVGFAPMCLSVVALFGPLFDPAIRKTKALQGQSRASILCDDVPSECEPVDTTTTSGALLQTR
jgi:hypothetical protein